MSGGAQRVAHRGVGRRKDFGAGRGAAQQGPQRVHGLEQQRDPLRRDGELLLAQPLQQVFQGVRHFGDAGESHHRRVALEAVRHAENAVQQLGVRGIRLERHQAFFEGAQVLGGLGEERLEQQLAVLVGELHGQIFRTHALPSRVWNTSLRPCAPPTSSATTGIPASLRTLRARATFCMPNVFCGD